MLAPAGGRTALSTAPAPVWMPQPNGATTSSGTAGSSLTTFRSVATAWVAKLDWPKKCEWIGLPARRRAVDPSGRVAPKLRPQKSWQTQGRPAAQVGHDPQEPKLIATRSPTPTFVTAVPTASTTPAPSWPSTAGSGTGYHWSRMIRSVWQIPQAATRTSSSSPRSSSTSSSSIANAAPWDSVTAAWIRIGNPAPQRATASRVSRAPSLSSGASPSFSARARIDGRP
jgi:hypothetical protein